jgi:cell division protein FtsB
MRLLILILAAAVIMLQIRLWLSDDGFREVWRLTALVEQRTVENRRLAERNAELKAEVQDLKQGQEASEELARTELGMLRHGETFYQIVPSHKPAEPAAAER